MDNIKSFELDHDSMTPGFYCLGEANGVYTYDMRFKYPNKGDYISYAALHSIEHLFAVVIRNSEIKTRSYISDLWDVERVAIYCYSKFKKNKREKLLSSVLKNVLNSITFPARSRKNAEITASMI